MDCEGRLGGAGEWADNFGPGRFIDRLTLRDGKLVHIEAGSYGHSRHS
jgi:hypothetical protein